MTPFLPFGVWIYGSLYLAGVFFAAIKYGAHEAILLIIVAAGAAYVSENLRENDLHVAALLVGFFSIFTSAAALVFLLLRMGAYGFI